VFPRIRPGELRHGRGHPRRRRPDPLTPLTGKPTRAVLAGLVAAALLPVGLALFVLWAVPSDTYLLLPDAAHPAAPVVKVKGEKPDHGSGGIYFLDVIERKASQLEIDFPGLAPDGATFVPPSQVQPPGVSQSQNVQVELQAMALSQQIAAAVAERELGYKVKTVPTGARVTAIGQQTPADGKLIPGDVIVAVDGHRVATPAQARKLLRQRHPGDVVTLGVRNQTGLRTVVVKTIADPSDPSRPLIGVLLEQAARIHLPVSVAIDTGSIGGPSAGLALALEVMEKLGRDVDRGYKVAATGEIFLDGAIGPIGGVRQKIFGARTSGVDILLAPAGDNARVARRYAGHVRVIPVETFRQALHALATLPPKR
jgi:PDZ domain-containing protein